MRQLLEEPEPCRQRLGALDRPQLAAAVDKSRLAFDKQLVVPADILQKVAADWGLEPGLIELARVAEH